MSPGITRNTSFLLRLLFLVQQFLRCVALLELTLPRPLLFSYLLLGHVENDYYQRPASNSRDQLSRVGVPPKRPELSIMVSMMCTRQAEPDLLGPLLGSNLQPPNNPWTVVHMPLYFHCSVGGGGFGTRQDSNLKRDLKRDPAEGAPRQRL